MLRELSQSESPESGGLGRWPYVFFAAAVIYIMIGVCWGFAMGATRNFATAPAHAHLNLIGWVSQGMMGVFYAVLGQRTPKWLVATNFTLINIGVVCMISGLGLMMSGLAPEPKVLPLMMVGEPSAVLGFASFAGAVFYNLARAGKPVAKPAVPAQALPAAA